MTRLAATQLRLFKNVFLCKNCGVKVRIEARKILEGSVKCRRCGRKAFRAMKKQ